MKNECGVEILLVEDNPSDEELAIRALTKHNLSNKIFVARDGAEALEYIFAAGQCSGKDTNCCPKVILLDLKLWIGSAAQDQIRPKNKAHTGGGAHLLPRRK